MMDNIRKATISIQAMTEATQYVKWKIHIKDPPKMNRAGWVMDNDELEPIFFLAEEDMGLGEFVTQVETIMAQRPVC